MTPGSRYTHVRNGVVIRRVEVVRDNGTQVLVRAINGPMAGTEYVVAKTDLER